jgi:hypothetical protein
MTLTKCGAALDDFYQMLSALGDLGLLRKVKHGGIGMTLTKCGAALDDFDELDEASIWGLTYPPEVSQRGLGGVLPYQKRLRWGSPTRDSLNTNPDPG